MVWYSHLLKNIPQFIVIHTVKGFGIVNKAEIDVFWNSLAFSMIQQILAMQETWAQFLGREDPLEKEMATHSSIFAC